MYLVLVPAPEVSILESEFTTDGTSSVVLNCSAMVNTTYLTFGRLRYLFTWRRQDNFLKELRVVTKNNEVGYSHYTLQLPGDFRDNFTCSVRALEIFNRLLPSTTAMDTAMVIITGKKYRLKVWTLLSYTISISVLYVYHHASNKSSGLFIPCLYVFCNRAVLLLLLF